MKVAAFQAPLLSADPIAIIKEQVRRCEAEDIAILCCPEAILGGLADYAPNPLQVALPATSLEAALASLASDTVTTIVGFTELTNTGDLFNSAAIYRQGSVIGIYRKWHPAINRSVYKAGRDAPVFTIGGLTFGIILCNDSNFAEPANLMCSQGATALFIPTNNGLRSSTPPNRVVAHARRVDLRLAIERNLWIIRADTTGVTDDLVSNGSSAIVDPHGILIQEAKELTVELLVGEID